ncbi:hypothetical protein [Actinophytocola oryzae]|uniref:Uncharacterized protein n=1 Tax=Actinophytocola oryzae TaxID=502181 RepID=A0A4R7VFX3_9PSEU|nr:hypothetical protein [Actinophytocola oryzae]TDV47938.1 hypothetical protein CLV71_109173 [Actinophytocola oryzae]
MDVPSSALYPVGFSRPDLPVPGAPGPVWPRRLVGLREPGFSAASRRAARLVVVAALVVLAGEFLVDDGLRPFVVAVAAGVAAYAGLAAVSLAVLRRRQARFERTWLVAQSDVLRARRFDVLRFTTSEPVETGQGRWAVRRVYDLTRRDEVERLLGVRRRADADGVVVPVTVEFSYPTDDGVGLEQIRGELGSIHLEDNSAAGRSARVRFPTAHYGVRPSAERPTTYWVLGRPTLTVTRLARDQAPAR